MPAITTITEPGRTSAHQRLEKSTGSLSVVTGTATRPAWTRLRITIEGANGTVHPRLGGNPQRRTTERPLASWGLSAHRPALGDGPEALCEERADPCGGEHPPHGVVLRGDEAEPAGSI